MATAGPALVFEAAEQGSVVMAQLTGVINEDNALEERLTATRGKGVLIDLSNIERINSCGVRDWIRFAQRLEAAGNNLYLLRCSPVVVAQLNMVRNFCGEKGQVVSFQAPFFCPNCDEERTETFPAATVGAGGHSPDAVCPTCKSPMEFDDLPDLYFAFAKLHASRGLPPDIQTAVDIFGSPQDIAKMAQNTPSPRPGGSGVRPPVVPPPSATATPPVLPPRPGGSGLRPPTGLPPPAATAAPAAGLRPSNPALRPPGAPPAPAAQAAPPARPSNPALRPPPSAAAPVAPVASAAQAARPSNPGLRPATPAPATAASASAVAAPAAQGAAPAATAARGNSGPKPPVARPLMGGSPFPAQRPSGLKPAGAPPPPNGTDPTKK